MRSRNCKTLKAKFPCYNNQDCPKNGCEELDTQEHCLECDTTYPLESRTENIKYSDIFINDIIKQSTATK